MVQRVFDIMRDWRCSPFEHEGATRHGLRAALCAEGYGWERSDHEADLIVQAGLSRMGAVRPTWDQGQPEYVLAREDCRWCARPMPAEEAEGLRRGQFCSVECARAAITARELRTTNGVDKVAMAAAAVIRRAVRPQLTCEQCNKKFQQYGYADRRQAPRFCSHRCAHIASRTVAERPCETCRQPFRPAQNGKAGKFCSVACKNARPLDDATCVICSRVFEAKTGKDQSFCSHACCKMAWKIRSGVVKRMSTQVFDYVFRAAA